MLRRFAIILILAVSCLAQEKKPDGEARQLPGPPNGSPVLRSIITDINQQMQVGDADYKQAIAGLGSDVDKLTAVLDAGSDAGSLEKTERIVAFFYRAKARALIGQIHWHHGETMDVATAETVVADLDKVIASDVDAPEWGVMTSEAQYMAGSMAMSPLKSASRAYVYWEKCALQDHAGCLNLMANARLTGVGGVRVDIRQALDYHNRVFDTGIAYTCAGAESARSIAEITYFTGVRRPGDDELEWLQKAYGLLDQLQDHGIKRTCRRFETEIDEFLYRLARGERKDSLLQDAAAVGDGLGEDAPTRKAVVQYLSGAISSTTFAAAVAASKNDFDFCAASLYGLWYSELTKNRTEGKRYHLALARRDRSCSVQLAYAKKFSLPVEAAPRPAAGHPQR
jgi:hypothetical protein